MTHLRRLGALTALPGALLAGACYDFHVEGPEHPPPVVVPRLVSVSIEYRQLPTCLNVATTCDEPVVFFGSWMREPNFLVLTADPRTFVWRGTATGVPVNYPPRDEPYLVRLFDPFLREGPTEGGTAERLRVGGELLTRFDAPGGPREGALVYVDENGHGHNPF